VEDDRLRVAASSTGIKMEAADFLRRGDLNAALTRLLGQVRDDPANPKFRVFLFQLSCVTGDWSRAKSQLEVAVGLDEGALLMGRVYGDAIECIAEQIKVFAGEATPTIFGEPQPWMAELCEALKLDCRGQHAAAARLRGRAFAAAPATTGRIDGQDFAWIADADSRLGPALEVIVNGRYYWMPFDRLTRIAIEAPTDLRDQVWMPVRLFLANGGETVALIPTRYAGSEQSSDPLIRLARKTEWAEIAPDTFAGRGQRMFATDIGDFPLMDIRSVEFARSTSAAEGVSLG
jgi:type VI secretion system protein ImpE